MRLFHRLSAIPRWLLAPPLRWRLQELWELEDGNLAKSVAWQAPVVCVFAAGPNAALLTAPDVALFIADTNYELVEAAEIHETLGTDGGAVSLDLFKATGTQAVGSGVTMLASVFNLKATVNTVVRKNLSNGGLTTTGANRRVAAGNRVGLDFQGTMTAVTGVNATVVLRRMNRPSY